MTSSEFFTIRRTFAEYVWKIPPDSLKVLVVLAAREEAQENLKLGLTITELARQSGLSVAACRHALEWLASNEDVGGPLIGLDSKGKHYEMWVAAYVTGRVRSTNIPFTYDDKDEKKIEKKEAEVRQIERELTARINKERSGLVDLLYGEERNVVDEIERHQGRGYSPIEAYFLGKSMASYGPERVRSVFRKVRSARNTVQALFAVLRKGAMGSPATQREVSFEKGLDLAEL